MLRKQTIRSLPYYTEERFLERREYFLELGYDNDTSTELAYWSFVFPNIKYENLQLYVEEFKKYL